MPAVFPPPAKEGPAVCCIAIIMNVRRINDWTLDSKIVETRRPFVVLFTVPVERGCQQVRNELLALDDEFADVHGFEIDLSEHPGLVERFSLQHIPTIIVFADGEERGRHAGLGAGEAVRRLLKSTPGPRR